MVTVWPPVIGPLLGARPEMTGAASANTECLDSIGNASTDIPTSARIQKRRFCLIVYPRRVTFSVIGFGGGFGIV